MNRRKFLSSAVCGTAGALGLTALGAEATLGAEKLKKFGVQLYTVRRQMGEDFEGSLEKIAAIGYKQVEFAGYYNRDPKQIRALLDRLGLEAPSAHVPLADLGDKLQKTIDDAKTVGHRLLICPFLMPNQRQSLDQYKQHAEVFNRAGEACKKAGVRFGYHNHDFEFVTLDGKLPFDQLLADTDAGLVGIELDLYWTVRAGQNPVALLKKYPGRFAAFHVKDMDKTPKQFFTEVGRGVINFKEIFRQGRKDGVDLFIVEQDQTPGSPFDSLKISYDYLKDLEF